MKKQFLLVALIAIVICLFISCNRDEKQQEQVQTQVEWNVTADASGCGSIIIGFPTGNVEINGSAQVCIGSYNVPNENITLVSYKDVIETPDAYSEQAVEAANNIANKSFFHIDTIEGNWNVNIVGYAKIDKIYIAIDERWPEKQDSLIY